ncbi:nitrate- and nitrite sensing domain-containing protein [Streptomyces sp. LE64]|uniref:nitrate- and nitrite sensing domain-containing protein n=1 Tax=Streptomyces sp. LE64 TaxID=3448653 RepID=UPI0040410D7D
MQGRFKRDGSGPAEPEPRGGTDRGSSPQHAQNPGPVSVVSNNDGARPAGPGGPQGPGGTSEAAPAGAGGTPPPPAPSAKPKVPTGPGSRIALRNWRISTRLVSLLALPVVAATSLGALRINESMDDIQQLDNMKLLTDMTDHAIQLATALQNERDKSAGPLANGGKATDFEVKGPRERTNRARETFFQGTHAIDEARGRDGLEGIDSTIQSISSRLTGLTSAREKAFKDPIAYSQTVDLYSELIEDLLALTQDMAQATSNPEMIQRTRSLAAFASAKEYASAHRAVIAASLPPNNKERSELSELDRHYAQTLSDKEMSELSVFGQVYQGNDIELLKPIDKGQATIKESEEYATRLLRVGPERATKRSYKDWLEASTTKIDAMNKIERTLLDEMEQKARELRKESERGAIISGALILVVLGVSLIGAFIVARSMIRSLRRLQDTATKVAQDRLPELVKQLSESDPQDVDTSVESVGVHSRDEIGQVAAAFDDVHREAVRLAAEQALLRGNVNAMFTNLSRRSQGLIQRQLSLISELESREADPDQLSSLFKLDHLATRMRRNGENLLVLAGEEPGRRWTRPVPLVDVLRAAASEVEQYERIELSSVPGSEVAGRVVNDLVHLLAELLENATSFSSPQTKVKVTGHALPDGRVLIEIHDTGIGLSPEDLAAINERLASPPTVDVSVSRRMGLFVVGRLSQRHGIRIQLRPSDSGGTTALVMLPVDVAQSGKRPPVGKPGAPGAPTVGPPGGVPSAAQAAAGAAAARQNRPGGRPAPGPQGPGGPGATPPVRQPGRPAPAGTGAFAPGAQGLQSTGAGQRGGRPPGGAPTAGAPGFGGPRQGGDSFDGFGARPGKSPADRPDARPERVRPGQDAPRPQLPARGGPRAELPGADGPQSTPDWSAPSTVAPVPRASGDAPRGHEEPPSTPGAPGTPRFDERPGNPPAFPPADRQGAGATAEFGRPVLDAPAPDFGAPRPDPGFGRPGDGAQDGRFVRSDVFGAPKPPAEPAGPIVPAGPDTRNPAATGQFPVAQPPSYDDREQHAPGYGQDAAHTGQFEQPAQDTGQYALPAPGAGAFPPGAQDTGSYERPAPEPAPYERPLQDTGSYERPAHRTGQFERPAQESGRFEQPGDTGAYELPAHRTGQFERPALDTGQYALPDQDTGQYEQPAHDTGQYALPSHQTGSYERPVPPYGQAPDVVDGPSAARPAAPLPPAGPGDGRTPLFDTLETDWFSGQRVAEQQPAEETAAPGLPERPTLSVSPAGRSDAEAPAGRGPQGSGSWRTSPNDELVRQAERVRQPTAGGVTTSGLPRRVPRANLVAGTAQQQQHQTGPQVSRAPDDVRGRLTNLRRGIQQGRQAGNGPSTGSYPRPTHQQEH